LALWIQPELKLGLSGRYSTVVRGQSGATAAWPQWWRLTASSRRRCRRLLSWCWRAVWRYRWPGATP